MAAPFPRRSFQRETAVFLYEYKWLDVNLSLALQGTSPLVKLAREDPVPSSSHAIIEVFSTHLCRSQCPRLYVLVSTHSPKTGAHCGTRMSELWLAHRTRNSSGLVGLTLAAHPPPPRNVKRHSNNHTRMHRAQRGGASKLRSAAAEGLRLRGAAPVRDRTRWGDDQTACAHRQGTRAEGAQGGIGRYGIELTLAAADKVGVILAASVCPASSIHPVDREAWAVDQGLQSRSADMGGAYALARMYTVEWGCGSAVVDVRRDGV